MRILEGEKVAIDFGGLAALCNVDFHLDQGEVVGLIGPNGAGKTTLLNLISGSLTPTSGVIKFKGEKITGLKRHEICRRGIARTFQSVKLFGNMTVLVNVVLGSLFGTPENPRGLDIEQGAREILKFVELSEKQDTIAKDLTLTDQKRLEVARALATKPELLLLDEVMAGLNPTEVTGAVKLIKEINNKGITILMVEHVMRAIMSISDRIIVLHHGEKIADGTPQQIIKDRKVVETYLGTGVYVNG
jgi:branched-chain amino acid transport system ATP-binding protein